MGLRHAAALYRDSAEFLREVTRFASAGLEPGQPVLVAVPGTRIGPIRERLGPRAGQVTWADMTELGANPARIIPALREFAARHRGRPVRCVCEAAWPGRSQAELIEVARHEALIGLALASTGASLLCPYDAGRLGDDTLTAAQRTHPDLRREGRPEPSQRYAGPGGIPPELDQSLPDPPLERPRLAYGTTLAPVRAFVAEQARRCGLSAGRAGDLVIAAHELTANTLLHTEGGGTVSVWAEPGEVICEVGDSGFIRDPLAGRRGPEPGAIGGHGLWVVQQVCDLVELRTGPGGSTIRLHLRTGL